MQVRFQVSESEFFVFVFFKHIINLYHYTYCAGYSFKSTFYTRFHLSLIPVRISPILQMKKVRSREVK